MCWGRTNRAVEQLSITPHKKAGGKERKGNEMKGKKRRVKKTKVIINSAAVATIWRNHLQYAMCKFKNHIKFVIRK
jgi:hypothetical protein